MPSETIIPTPTTASITLLLAKILDVRPAEIRALAWSWLYIFALFLAYYVLRPIREDLGVAGGVSNLPWLFTGTLLAMVAVNPLFAYAVRRWPRERFIAITYRFFMLNLLAFMVLLVLATPEQHVSIGRAFFIWVSVFNLFVVSVFWSFIVDVFDAEQGKRLFGFLAAGATLVNALTLVFQIFLTGRVMGLVGVALTLCTLPLFSVIGFSALIASPSIGVFVVVQVLRRVSNFALARPAREVLFTSVAREDRYKTKNFIDTVVYRGGDQVGSWSYAGLTGLGLGLPGVAIVAVPLSLIWLAMSFWLGWRQQRWERVRGLSAGSL